MTKHRRFTNATGSPRTGLRSAQNNWDFWTLLPEALHQVTIVMSDRGIPKSFLHMHLFGSHTFSMINAENKRTWVKFHFRSQQGIENLTDEAAAAVVANDRESNGRDLLEAIERGDFPRWKLFIQVMTEEQAKAHKHNPFDVTKVWPKADYPKSFLLLLAKQGSAANVRDFHDGFGFPSQKISRGLADGPLRFV